ncbi:MAG TPA: peptide chain release factor N(5)-glutamine methyltransferase [Polyangiales bacterium]|nr:peptide chain release factor N(5)-glutamine methyltransferase [Polyangiales bacterium]
MSEAWTTRRLLAWMTQDFKAQELGTPRLDAEILISYALGIDRVRLYMDLERPLSNLELAAVKALVVRRRQREPVAYLIGRREFYRRDFKVTPAVLIPRPDTETLIERACEILPADQALTVLDLCTGSGAIAVTLAAERPQISVVATDISDAALEIARENARKHDVEARVELRRGDLFDAVEPGARYDLIVANPPYIRDDELPQLAAELHHEPRLALTSGPEGLDVLTRLCAQVDQYMTKNAVLLFEVGAGQSERVAQLLAANPGLTGVTTHRDLGGIERVVEARAASV